MAQDFQGQRSLFQAIMDLELPLTELQDVVVALDLIATGSLLHGIDSDDTRGLKAVTQYARELGERLRKNWAEVLKLAGPGNAEADGVTPGDEAAPEDKSGGGRRDGFEGQERSAGPSRRSSP